MRTDSPFSPTLARDVPDTRLPQPRLVAVIACCGLVALAAATTAALSNGHAPREVTLAAIAPASVATLSPEVVPVGSGNFLLTVTGEGFAPGTVVLWNGERRTTQVFSPRRLAAWIAAGDIANDGPHAVQVVSRDGGRTRPSYVGTYARGELDARADRVLGQPGFSTRTPYHAGVGSERDGVVNAAGLDRLGPQGVAIDPASGRLFVVESRAARVLSWPSAQAFQNADAADLVIGQPDEFSAGPKQADAGSFCSPQSVAVDGAGSIYVSDDCYHRVLRFDPPFTTGMAAARAYGQGDSFETTASNQGGRSAASLSGPLGLAARGDTLFVHDGGNRRVLVFRNARTATKADVVIGQPDAGALETSSPGANRLAAGDGALALDGAGRLFVADTAGNRVLRFTPPFANDMAADLVLGQKDFAQVGRSNLADGLWRPSALAFDAGGNLLVADAGNHRVVRYVAPLATGMAATGLLGQSGFALGSPGVGRSHFATPSGVAVDGGGDVIVADAGNARVLAFDRPFPVAASAMPERGASVRRR